ncbi:hypothetical protein I5M27_02565 [Adhaeribacter sp. BT258]|uniref:Uncharacterized protein n=1 Tax=Adhaeribacter terrigena TaxID=2793070 RepID=A0ABS1BXR1_9BACT|nr:hypothetical protein [Adhaeribacter terrigena]MBK0401849.1 hypothetical protein [Adhaeribacter terrigena]
MKKRFLGIATGTMMLAGGTFFAFAGNDKVKDCPLKGTADCPIVKECKLKGTPDCPLVKEAKAKSTISFASASTLPSCCKKK